VLPSFYDDVRAALAERATNHRLWKRLTRTPLSARFTKYSVGALVAFMLSNITFAIFYVAGCGTTVCSIAGFLGGAIPNWVLTRRWAWSLSGRPPVRQWLSYIVVSIGVVLSTAAATGWTDHQVKTIPSGHGFRVIIVTASYVFVQLVLFLLKFLIYEYWVFAPVGRVRARLRSLRQVPRTARANRIP
jgi:putative flippase GtrA